MHCSNNFFAGEMDLTRSKLINIAEPKVVTAKAYFSIQLIARDSFGNAASISENHFQVDIRKVRLLLTALRHLLPLMNK